MVLNSQVNYKKGLQRQTWCSLLLKCFAKKVWWVICRILWRRLADLHLLTAQLLPIWHLNMVRLVVFFPIDEVTFGYLKLTGRQSDRIELVKAYSKAQAYGVMWR